MLPPQFGRQVLACLTSAVVFSACASTAARKPPGGAPAPGYRIAASGSAGSLTMDDVAERAASADVVFFGEEHTDAETHRRELELLEAIQRRNRRVVLSLEMFERDVQGLVDDYLAGRISEETFLAGSRPWARYATDYRGLVELAKSNGWPVVASNIPRAIAAAIGRHGITALDSLGPRERGFAASEIECPDDEYQRRFFQEMKGHSSGGAAAAPADSLPTAVAQRFYIAQCAKDETMGESIAMARQRFESNALIVHYDGSFHSDFGMGTVERLHRRAPEARVVVITAIPVADPSTATVSEPKRADYIIFTKAAPKPAGT